MYVPPLMSSCSLRQMKLPQSFYNKISKLIDHFTGTYNLVILHYFLLIPNFTHRSPLTATTLLLLSSNSAIIVCHQTHRSVTALHFRKREGKKIVQLAILCMPNFNKFSRKLSTGLNVK